MKTIIKIAALLSVAMMSSRASAQITTTVCTGGSTTITAVNSLNLTNTSYTLNPGGIISISPLFVITPIVNTVYTLSVGGTDSNFAWMTTSNTVSVTVSLSQSPVFEVVSPASNFSIGCGTNSVAVINFQNWNTTPPGSAMSFAAIPPGSPTASTIFGLALTYSASVPGLWTFVARDDNNTCTTYTTVSITENTVSPGVVAAAATQTLSCNVPSVALTGSTPSNANVSYEWNFLNGANPNTIFSPTMVAMIAQPASPSNTVCGNFTLKVTDLINGCSSETMITLWQNLAVPIPNFGGWTPPNPPIQPCGLTHVLVNGSTINSPFFSPLGTSVTVWAGPAPQVSASGTATYLAQTTGVYSMTVEDRNSGCTTTGTINVFVEPTASFVHVLAAGQATFNNTSLNAGINASYYWDFGDGNTSLLENPIHTYQNGGSHLVTFIVSNPSGLCSDTLIQSVNVSGVPCVANSGFSMVPTVTAQVWDVIPDYPWNISNASWDWGDGSTSNTLYTSHQYASAGLYNICLSVTVSCAASSSTCSNYNVYRMSQQAQMIAVNVVAPALISGVAAAPSEADLSWSIVPNPNAGEFKLVMNQEQKEQIHVVISDVTGRVLQEQILEAGSQSVNAKNLPAGMYFVNVQCGSVKVTKRMLIQQ